MRALNRNQVAKQIKDAYGKLEDACDRHNDAGRLLRAAFASAVETERQHRGGVPMGGDPASGRNEPYTQSARCYARYFVVKWFVLHDGQPPKDWVSAATIRPDVRYAQGLRELLDSYGANPFATPPACASWDYPLRNVPQ